MEWNIEQARNGENTLVLNGRYLYSKYNPQNDVSRFLASEIKEDYKKFIMVGLGLGYHIKTVLEMVPDATIQYVLLDEKELQLCDLTILKDARVSVFSADEQFNDEAQIIIPQSFLSALEPSHPLFPFIEDIKIRQVSYARFKDQMAENFAQNIQLFKPIEKPNIKRKAALVASGPSLNDTIHWLKAHENEFDIYCVGSALKMALKNKLQLEAVMMTDAQDYALDQLPEGYDGKIICLPTVNYKAILKHKGKLQLIFQKGYRAAEEFAVRYAQPLFETGGSVATTAFSYIEWAGYEELYLFGQDLGFSGERTHAKGSTSGRKVDYVVYHNVLANDGTMIKTTPSWITFKRWFDQAIPKSPMIVWNTSLKGAQLKGAQLLNLTE